MRKLLFLVILVGGVGLLLGGINATDTLAADLYRFFKGEPANNAVWMVITGVSAAIVGLTMLLRKG